MKCGEVLPVQVVHGSDQDENGQSERFHLKVVPSWVVLDCGTEKVSL